MSADTFTQPSAGIAANPRSTAPIADQIDRLRNSLGRLDALLDEHTGRLSPILSPEYETKAGDVSPPMQPASPVTGNLTEFVVWTQRLADTLAALTGRLEI